MKVTTKIVLSILLVSFSYFIAPAQVAINEDGASPDESAMLEIASNSKGILIPRMTSSEDEY